VTMRSLGTVQIALLKLSVVLLMILASIRNTLGRTSDFARVKSLRMPTVMHSSYRR
jgi:hypothetical protein